MGILTKPRILTVCPKFAKSEPGIASLPHPESALEEVDGTAEYVGLCNATCVGHGLDDSANPKAPCASTEARKNIYPIIEQPRHVVS